MHKRSSNNPNTRAYYIQYCKILQRVKKEVKITLMQAYSTIRKENKNNTENNKTRAREITYN
jgi:hypothetical protein